MKHYVRIYTHAENTVIKEFGPYRDKRWAEKIDGGVNTNLNHEQYYTLVEDVEDEGDNLSRHE